MASARAVAAAARSCVGPGLTDVTAAEVEAAAGYIDSTRRIDRHRARDIDVESPYGCRVGRPMSEERSIDQCERICHQLGVESLDRRGIDPYVTGFTAAPQDARAAPPQVRRERIRWMSLV